MLVVSCKLCYITGGENNTQIDCILLAVDVTIMTPASKTFTYVQNWICNKTYISDFSILKIVGMAIFWILIYGTTPVVCTILAVPFRLYFLCPCFFFVLPACWAISRVFVEWTFNKCGPWSEPVYVKLRVAC